VLRLPGAAPPVDRPARLTEMRIQTAIGGEWAAATVKGMLDHLPAAR
jgi:hypothetical protein